MQLDLGDFQIRSWRSDDEEALARHADNRSMSITLADRFPYPYTREHAREWIDRCREAEPETAFALATPEEAIGGIGLEVGRDVFHRSAEVGYWLAQPYWGRGIATRALVAFSEWAFAHFAVERLSAGVFEWNPASARVLEKAGYRLEGRLRRAVTKAGRTGDLLIYARLRGEGR